MLPYGFTYVTTNLYQSGSTPNRILTELPFTGVNFTQQLNSVGSFQGHVLLSGINSTQQNIFNGTLPGKTILWVIYTDAEAGISTPIWSGVIWQREYDSQSQSLAISAQEMIGLYDKRLISEDKDYDTTATDPCVIAKNLMLYAEAKTHGSTGLTYGLPVTAGTTIHKKYNGYELKPVFQAIKDLSQNFFDFAIKPVYDSNLNLVNQFVMGVPLGVVYANTPGLAQVLQFPGNIISYKFPEDAVNAANILYGLGTGANSSKLQAKAISTDFITSGDWPLLEDRTNYTDITNSALLSSLTLGKLQAIAYPPTTVEVVLSPYIDPVFPLYSIGDEIRVDIKDDYFPGGLNGLILRIVGISVNPGETGPARITLTLTRQLTAGTV
jgi:hypothetical protein